MYRTLPKQDQKKYTDHVKHTLIYADISIFSLEINNFCCIRIYRQKLRFNTFFLIIFTVLESLKFISINNFDDVRKSFCTRLS